MFLFGGGQDKADIRNPLRYLLICVQNNDTIHLSANPIANIRLTQMRTVIASVSLLQSHRTVPCLPR